MSDILLEVENLKVHYPVKAKSILPKKEYVKAVDGISFQVHRQEAFGIVGESGCGKSTTGHAIVGLLHPTAGDIRLEGETIVSARKRYSKEMAKKIQIIFRIPIPRWIPVSRWDAVSQSRCRFIRSERPMNVWRESVS